LSEREEREATRQPQESQQEKFFRLFNEYLETELGHRSVAVAPGPAPLPVAVPSLAPSYDELDEETKKAIDMFIDVIRPDVQEKAVELLLNEVRDKIARTGDINRIIKMTKKGKKPSLKRKKGCIFVQFGEGTPEDPIEEVMIAST